MRARTKPFGGLGRNLYPETSQLLIDYLYGYYNKDPRRVSFICSNNMTIKAEAFSRVNGFDTDFKTAAAEDRDLIDKSQ
jgi:hypothetical protein